MELNIPEVVAEVKSAFLRYQHAVDTKDVAVMNELFWTSPFTVRFGPNGTLIGHDAISAFRRARNTNGIKRVLRNTVITTFGTDFAVANTESDRQGVTNRQSQTWVRMSDGWRIVGAHVSDEPPQ